MGSIVVSNTLSVLLVPAQTSKEVEDMHRTEVEAGGYKQQDHEHLAHPKADRINVIAQGLAFSMATPKDAGRVTELINKA